MLFFIDFETIIAQHSEKNRESARHKRFIIYADISQVGTPILVHSKRSTFCD